MGVAYEVASHGTRATAADYSLADPRLPAYAADPVYYRLRQVAAGGTSGYSPARPVQVAGALAFAVAAFPSPPGGPAYPRRHDATCHLIFSYLSNLQRGTTTLELPEAGQLATGVYCLQATQASQRTVLPLTRE